MIKPTVGRVVWYYGAYVKPETQPCAAIVAHVHSDSMVNLCVFDPNGVPGALTSIRLVQEDEPVPDTCHCRWMPYQIGQAKKA